MKVRNISLPKAKSEQLVLDLQQRNIIKKYTHFQTKYCLRSWSRQFVKKSPQQNKIFKLHRKTMASKQEYLLARHN